MSFTVKNLTSSAISIDDLGFELAASSTYNMLDEPAKDVQMSGRTGGDLYTQINAGSVIVLDPKDDVTQLSPSDSIIVVAGHNDPNWGIVGAVISDMDDVNNTGATTGDVLQLDSNGTYVPVDPSTLAASIELGDLIDVNDGTAHALGEFYILQGDGFGHHTMVNGATDNTLFVPFLENTTGNVVSQGNQTDVTVTYNGATNKIDFAVDDVFLRNTGDTLDSGTLSVASGASIDVTAGGKLTIADVPINGNDATNKQYVDTMVQGADAKNSVYLATTPTNGDIGGTYDPVGGSASSGSFAGATDTIDGSAVTVGDRIIIKNQTDSKQNGIYVVTAMPGTGGAGFADYERAPDHNGDPTNEVSAGNLAFIEFGVVNEATSWIVTGIGDLVLNTDDVNWTQFAGAGSYLAGNGLGINGNEFYLSVDNLPSTTLVGTDELAFNDVTDDVTKSQTFNGMITDLGLLTSTNLTASDGVLITNGDIQLDIDGLSTGTVGLLSEIVFQSASGSGTHLRSTMQSALQELDIPHGISGDGILVRTANDVYTQRAVNSSPSDGDEGITILNGDGVSGNIEVGVSIDGLASSANALAATNELMVFDGTNNLKYTGQQIADGVEAMLGGLGNSFTTMVDSSGTSFTATSSTDIMTFDTIVGGGITTEVNAATKTMQFGLDVPGLGISVVPITSTDVLAVGNATGTTQVPMSKIVDDLNIVNDIGATPGILTSDGAGNYNTTSIVAALPGNTAGIVVTNADAVGGSPTIGLNIANSPAASEDLTAVDEFIIYNESSTANQTFTGQEVANGVSTILGLGGMSVSTINGQEVLTLIDPTRANKVLSVLDTSVTWAENRVGDNDWLQIGSAVDADSGFIVPMDATIVKITAHTENNNGNTKPIDIYIDNTQYSGYCTFAAATAGEDSVVNVTLNLDVDQGSKLRLRGNNTGGTIEDTVITIWLKWRA